MTIAIIGDWRGLALRGLAAVVFGALAILWPAITLLVLVLLFGAYALVDGVSALLSLARGQVAPGVPRWMLVMEGVVGIAIGGITFAWPGITTLALLLLIAARSFLLGVLEVVASVRLRREITNEWMLALAGALSIVFALAIVIWPIVGALAITWVIGFYAVFWGALLLGVSWKARRAQVGYMRRSVGSGSGSSSSSGSMRGARGAHA
jgi:uncharacterized membrane protein HdeD (DUF308 family)